MSELAHLVETLFTLRGYEAEPPSAEVLRFVRGDDRIAVRVREGREPLTTATAHEFAETLPVLGHAVVACAGEVGHEVRTILQAAGIEVWTREKLIHEVGKAYVEAAERGSVPPSPPAHEEPSHESAGAPHPAPASVATAVLAPAPGPLPLWSRPAAAKALPTPPVPTVAAIPLTPTTVQAPPAATPPLAPEPEPAHDGACFALTLDRDAALRMGVSRLLKVEKATLELVPLLAFRYACKLETKGAIPVPKHGLLAADAVTGAVRELKEPSFARAPPAQRLEAQLGQADAEPLVKRKVMEMHSQKMRVQSSMRNTLIVEERMVRPNPASIQLDAQGTWWLPIWTLEGQNGVMRVNGATGLTEDEKLKRAYAQDAEFL
jgi:hypothetical protein